MKQALAVVMIAAMGVTSISVPAVAKDKRERTYYEYDGRYYQTRAECKRAKKKAKTRGAVIGAVAGGAGGALLGGNLGESALAAGAGALAGGIIGNETKKC
ncbi:MAG: glycine zipper 2TM domain-containing protein [Sphingomonadaceae bacterium]